MIRFVLLAIVAVAVFGIAPLMSSSSQAIGKGIFETIDDLEGKDASESREYWENRREKGELNERAEDVGRFFEKHDDERRERRRNEE